MVPEAVAGRNAELLASGQPLRAFLDDDFEQRRPDGDDWIRVDRASAAIVLLTTGRVLDLSLDHDLGEEPGAGCGEDVVRWLEEQTVAHGRDLWPRRSLVVHSVNSVGAKRMEQGIARRAPMRRLAGRRWAR